MTSTDWSSGPTAGGTGQDALRVALERALEADGPSPPETERPAGRRFARRFARSTPTAAEPVIDLRYDDVTDDEVGATISDMADATDGDELDAANRTAQLDAVDADEIAAQVTAAIDAAVAGPLAAVLDDAIPAAVERVVADAVERAIAAIPEMIADEVDRAVRSASPPIEAPVGELRQALLVMAKEVARRPLADAELRTRLDAIEGRIADLSRLLT